MLAHDDSRALHYCDDVRSAVSQAHASLRGILTHLRSPMDPQGLVHALEAARRPLRRRLRASSWTSSTKCRPSGWAPEAGSPGLPHRAGSPQQRGAPRRRPPRPAAPRRAPDGRIEIVVEDDGAGLPSRRRRAGRGGSHYGLEIMRRACAPPRRHAGGRRRAMAAARGCVWSSRRPGPGPWPRRCRPQRPHRAAPQPLQRQRGFTDGRAAHRSRRRPRAVPQRPDRPATPPRRHGGAGRAVRPRPGDRGAARTRSPTWWCWTCACRPSTA